MVRQPQTGMAFSRGWDSTALEGFGYFLYMYTIPCNLKGVMIWKVQTMLVYGWRSDQNTMLL
jgi:hypothetical protein